ncbi:sensor histidine kinase [Paenibacillus soyae]|uniref:Histidine kinase n=1 Tax=Paenibacillus soyae TaxID=2969249 RepID=A0A9X2MID0_9BACL|nr:sensor histidine kinase [Paenibacillus soyae]MCR2802318.1 histidine kinase [Paenibacillus soyae]
MMFNPLTKLNMKQQLILLFLVMVSPVFLLHWYGNYQAEKLLKNHVTNAYVELIKQNHALINRDIDTVNKITTTFIQNPITQQLVPSVKDTVIERVRKYDSVDNLLANNSIPLNGGEAVYYSLYIYDPEDLYFFAPKRQVLQTGVYFFSDHNKPVWFDEAVSMKGSGYMDIIETNVGLSRIQTLAYIRAVNDVKLGTRMIGVLVATKLDMKIQESFRSVTLPEGHLMMFTDWSGRILSATDSALNGKTAELPAELNALEPESIGTTHLITEDFIYISSNNRQLDQRLVYQIPVDSLLKQQNELKRIIQLITIAYMLLGCVFLLYFWRSLMTPLQKLAQFVRSYEPGKLVPETPGRRRHDEVGVLMSALYDMARRLNALIHYKYNMDLKAKESQLQLLYQQINPHLLYNTLESIYWKSTLEGNSESAEMIKELSKLMKIGLSRGRELIRLEEELEHAQAYVNLQQKRYSYEFKVQWHIPEAAKQVLIPKISLQPLIENAIIHGVKLMGEDGEIRISAALEGERVTIAVEDNGYKQADLAAIDRLLNEEKADHSLGYGIRNIHQRIRLHFGIPFGLGYRRREEGGTAAVIVFPATYEAPAP